MRACSSSSRWGLGRIVALHHRSHPRHTIFVNIFDTSVNFLKQQCDRTLRGGPRRLLQPGGHRVAAEGGGRVGEARGPVERPRVFPEPRDGRERVGELGPQASCPDSSAGGWARAIGFRSGTTAWDATTTATRSRRRRVGRSPEWMSSTRAADGATLQMAAHTRMPPGYNPHTPFAIFL